ncbi:MAG: helix-turn-helix domain-containing protein [Pseudomonadota bacterium]
MSEDNQQPLVTAIVATPDAGASCLFTMVDVLSSVGRDWELVHGQPPKPPRFLPRIVSVDGNEFFGPNEIKIAPHGALEDYPAPDLVLIPDFLVSPGTRLAGDYLAIAEWIREVHQAGAIVASVCSGALLLAASGLLDGEEATTHWSYCDTLSGHFPKVKVCGARILISGGAEHRVVTAGGASAWDDLLLYLIGRLAGPDEALRIAKLYLLQWHSDGQLPYAALSMGRQHDDRMIEQCQLWIADNYATENPVASMSDLCGLSERTFHRRFRKVTGQSPMAYVQALRIEEAKHLLETTDMAIDEVGVEVGYEEPASFRRLFRRSVGIAPSAYRRRFQPLFRLVSHSGAARVQAA